MSRPNVYPAELRQRAVRMVAEVRSNYESEWAAIGAVAQKLGIGTAETLRKWVRQVEVNADARAGVTTSDEAPEIKRLRREVAELRRANQILKAASRSPSVRARRTNGSRYRSSGCTPTTTRWASPGSTIRRLEQQPHDVVGVHIGLRCCIRSTPD